MPIDGRQDPEQHPDDGRLAAAIGSEQPKDRTSLNLKTDVAHRDQVAEPPRQVSASMTILFIADRLVGSSKTSAVMPGRSRSVSARKIDLDAKDLFGTFLRRLHIVWSEFSLSRDERDDTLNRSSGKLSTVTRQRLADLESDPILGYIRAYPQADSCP